jgi:hypothetical protein
MVSATQYFFTLRSLWVVKKNIPVTDAVSKKNFLKL